MKVMEIIERRGLIVKPPLRPTYPEIRFSPHARLLFATPFFPLWQRHDDGMSAYVDRRGTLFIICETDVAAYIFMEE